MTNELETQDAQELSPNELDAVVGGATTDVVDPESCRKAGGRQTDIIAVL